MAVRVRPLLACALVAGLWAAGLAEPVHDVAVTEDEDGDWTAEYSSDTTIDTSDDWRGGEPAILPQEDDEGWEHARGNELDQNDTKERQGAAGGCQADLAGGNESNEEAEVRTAKAKEWREMGLLELVFSLSRCWYLWIMVLGYCWHRGHLEIIVLNVLNAVLSFFVWALGLEGKGKKIRRDDKKREDKRQRKLEGQRKKGKAPKQPKSPVAKASATKCTAYGGPEAPKAP